MTNNTKIYGYINKDNYDYLVETKSELKEDGFKNISQSKLIKLGIMELRNKEYNEIKELLQEKELI